MNSLWIQKKLEFDEDMIQLTCPFCHDDKFFAHKDNEKMPKYCPMCGAPMDDTDASDAELVDTLRGLVSGLSKHAQELQGIIENKNEVNAELAAAVKTRDELIASLKCQLEQAQKDKENLMDILTRHLKTEDTILRNWQQRAIHAEEWAETVEKRLDEKEEELFTKHNEYAQLRHEYDLLNSLFEDMKRVIVKVRPHEWAALAKKHNRED